MTFASVPDFKELGVVKKYGILQLPREVPRKRLPYRMGWADICASKTCRGENVSSSFDTVVVLVAGALLFSLSRCEFRIGLEWNGNYAIVQVAWWPKK